MGRTVKCFRNNGGLSFNFYICCVVNQCMSCNIYIYNNKKESWLEMYRMLNSSIFERFYKEYIHRYYNVRKTYFRL